MKNTSAAFRWIVGLLRQQQVAFQISGGLAAIAYGAHRALYDIDISIPEESFPIVYSAVQPFVVFGPSMYKDAEWELLLLTVKYLEQEIDFGGAYQGKFCDRNTGTWISYPEDLSTSEIKTIFGIDVPVISKRDLINYKRLLGRDIDIDDIDAIS